MRPFLPSRSRFISSEPAAGIFAATLDLCFANPAISEPSLYECSGITLPDRISLLPRHIGFCLSDKRQTEISQADGEMAKSLRGSIWKAIVSFILLARIRLNRSGAVFPSLEVILSSQLYQKSRDASLLVTSRFCFSSCRVFKVPTLQL